MSHNKSEQNKTKASVESKVTEALDHDLQKINEQDAEVFAEMRMQALNAIPERKSYTTQWQSFGVFAAAASIVIALVLVFNSPQVLDTATPLEDFDIVLEEMDLEEDDIEMLENDIEFYLWLEENEQV